MFLVCGEALFDVFVPSPPDASGRVRMEGVPGGSPFNVALGLARLGVETALFAGLSRDRLGQALADRLAAEGVSLRFAVRRPEPTTLSVVTLTADGAPDYVFYGQSAADTALSPANVPALGPEILGLHFGSYAAVVPPMADAVATLAGSARGRLVTLDPNVRLGVEPDAGIWRARLDALVPHVAAIKASEEDLALLWPGRAADVIAADWLSRGPGLVVVTRGALGAVAFHGSGRAEATPPAVGVVDTVGAGDAVQSALIAALLEAGARSAGDVAKLPAQAVADLLERCVRAGAIACGRRGVDPPWRHDIAAPALGTASGSGQERAVR